ncbi:helix-turn-helix domain-containing protein [Oscillibacter sp.]|uniref:helix-turn-helix domain-containing protein n=1 Tax=Oscillibacter sp. TaxID=1945593 RepID=UPI0037CB5B5F
MDYISIAEAAEKWGITRRRVQVLCNQGRIPGLTKFRKAWAIPKDAEKPIDKRKLKRVSIDSIDAGGKYGDI